MIAIPTSWAHEKGHISSFRCSPGMGPGLDCKSKTNTGKNTQARGTVVKGIARGSGRVSVLISSGFPEAGGAQGKS